MADKDEKTEEPTAKRKTEARNKGQVAKSQDLNVGIGIVFMTLTLLLFGSRTNALLKGLLLETFSRISTFELNIRSITSLMTHMAGMLFNVIYPFLLSFLVIGILSNLVQVGWLFTFEKLKPDFSFLTKMQGLKKMFSPRALVELLKSLAKVTIVGFLIYFIVKKHLDEILYLVDKSLLAFMEQTFSIIFELCWKIALLLTLLGIFDLFWQKHQHKEQLKMTKQEVKDEHKQSEGDPKVKSKIRRLMQEAAMRSMMDKVPQATVVVTNPTFIAIAIQYDRNFGGAPTVVAKGKRLIAERIRDLANEHTIPIIENVPLARGLYDIVEPGDEIPAEFYTAVAEVLAYVYNQV